MASIVAVLGSSMIVNVTGGSNSLRLYSTIPFSPSLEIVPSKVYKPALDILFLNLICPFSTKKSTSSTSGLVEFPGPLRVKFMSSKT